jgi:hypothetical protein
MTEGAPEAGVPILCHRERDRASESESESESERAREIFTFYNVTL